VDAREEKGEGDAAGRLKPGQRTVAGVVTDDVYEALLRFQRDLGLSSMSRAVGRALLDWTAHAGFKPRAGEADPVASPGAPEGLKLAETRAAASSEDHGVG
jgi:hypothetical protein